MHTRNYRMSSILIHAKIIKQKLLQSTGGTEKKKNETFREDM